MALQDIFQQSQAKKSELYDNAFNDFNAAHGGEYTRAVWDEYYKDGSEAGQQVGPQHASMQQQMFLDNGYIPVDAHVMYGSQQTGKTPGQMLNEFFPGGTFEHAAQDNGNAGGYYYKTKPGTTLNQQMLDTLWPQKPGGTRGEIVKELAPMLMAIAGGMMFAPAGGVGMAATGAAETAGLSALGSMTGGGASSLGSALAGMAPETMGGMSTIAQQMNPFTGVMEALGGPMSTTAATQSAAASGGFAGGAAAGAAGAGAGSILDALQSAPPTQGGMSTVAQQFNPLTGLNEALGGPMSTTAALQSATTGGLGPLGAATGAAGASTLGDLIRQLTGNMTPGSAATSAISQLLSGQGGSGAPNATGQNALSALLNFLQQGGRQDALNAAAGSAASRADALQQPQRLPYQMMLAEMMGNPTNFFNTNPMVQAQLDLARRQFEARSAKHGVGGTQYADYLSHMQNETADTWGKQAELLGILGGFNQGPGNAGTVFGQLAGQAAQAGSDQWIGLGALAGNPAVSSLIGQGVGSIIDSVSSWFS